MRRLLLAILAVTIVMPACGKRRAGVPIYQADRIKFSHERHAAAEVECFTCHEDVYESKDLSVDLRPKEIVCLDCHQERKDTGECSFCHTDPKAPATYAPWSSDLRMNHEAHMERTEEDCGRCHSALPEPGKALAGTTTMDSCTSCHNHDKEVTAGTCDTCHVDLNRAPLRPIADYSHAADYLRAHGADARSSPATCGQCHDEPFCSECHAGTSATTIERMRAERVDRSFIHRGDYLARHAVDAAIAGDTCLSCHSESSCTTCHQAAGLTELSNNPRSPHPPRWLTAVGQSGHGRAARFEIASCAGCHDQGASSICVDCHRVGGIGGTPHPPGWSASHDVAEVSRNAMCSFCH